MDYYVIKEHRVSPFTPHEEDEFFVGYLMNYDRWSLNFKTTASIATATLFNLKDAAKAISQLNKLNMRFYEIAKFEADNSPNNAEKTVGGI